MKKIFVVFLMFFINLSADVRYLDTHYGRNFCDTLGDTSMRSKACASNKIFVPGQSVNSDRIQPIFGVQNLPQFYANHRDWLMGGGGVIDYNDPTLSDIVGPGMHPAETDNWSVYGDAGEKYQDGAFFR